MPEFEAPQPDRDTEPLASLEVPVEPVVDKEADQLEARVQAMMDGLREARQHEVQIKQSFTATEIERADGSRVVIWDGKEIRSDGFDDSTHADMKERGFMVYADYNSGSVLVNQYIDDVSGDKMTEYILFQFEDVPDTTNEDIDDPYFEPSFSLTLPESPAETAVDSPSPAPERKKRPWFLDLMLGQQEKKLDQTFSAPTLVEPQQISLENLLVPVTPATTLQAPASAPSLAPPMKFNVRLGEQPSFPSVNPDQKQQKVRSQEIPSAPVISVEAPTQPVSFAPHREIGGAQDSVRTFSKPEFPSPAIIDVPFVAAPLEQKFTTRAAFVSPQGTELVQPVAHKITMREPMSPTPRMDQALPTTPKTLPITGDPASSVERVSMPTAPVVQQVVGRAKRVEISQDFGMLASSNNEPGSVDSPTPDSSRVSEVSVRLDDVVSPTENEELLTPNFETPKIVRGSHESSMAWAPEEATHEVSEESVPSKGRAQVSINPKGATLDLPPAYGETNERTESIEQVEPMRSTVAVESAVVGQQVALVEEAHLPKFEAPTVSEAYEMPQQPALEAQPSRKQSGAKEFSEVLDVPQRQKIETVAVEAPILSAEQPAVLESKPTFYEAAISETQMAPKIVETLTANESKSPVIARAVSEWPVEKFAPVAEKPVELKDKSYVATEIISVKSTSLETKAPSISEPVKEYTSREPASRDFEIPPGTVEPLDIAEDKLRVIGEVLRESKMYVKDPPGVYAESQKIVVEANSQTEKPVMPLETSTPREISSIPEQPHKAANVTRETQGFPIAEIAQVRQEPSTHEFVLAPAEIKVRSETRPEVIFTRREVQHLPRVEAPTRIDVVDIKSFVVHSPHMEQRLEALLNTGADEVVFVGETTSQGDAIDATVVRREVVDGVPKLVYEFRERQVPTAPSADSKVRQSLETYEWRAPQTSAQEARPRVIEVTSIQTPAMAEEISDQRRYSEPGLTERERSKPGRVPADIAEEERVDKQPPRTSRTAREKVSRALAA